MDDNIQVVLCDATAGAGKTLLSVACAKIKVLGEQRYDSCCFVVPVNNEGVIGFRPGDTQAKTAEYFEPLHDSLYTIGEVPGRAIINDVSLKNGTGWIEARTPVFMRGINLANKYVILDECQNFTVQELKKIISRCHDSSRSFVLDVWPNVISLFPNQVFIILSNICRDMKEPGHNVVLRPVIAGDSPNISTNFKVLGELYVQD